VQPAGAFKVVVLPARNVVGTTAPPAVSCVCPNKAAAKGVAELIAARSPRLSKAIPLGEARVASPPVVVGLRVTAGVGLPVAVKLALAN